MSSRKSKSSKAVKKQALQQAQQVQNLQMRRLIGAHFSDYTNWMGASLTKINLDIETDRDEVVKRCRDLAKNSPIIRAYLSACVKNIVRKDGIQPSMPSQRFRRDIEHQTQ